MPQTTLTPEQRAPQYAFLFVLALILVLTAKMVAPYVISIVIGGILALMAAPLQKRLLNLKVKPGLAAGLTTTCVILLVVGPLTAFVSMSVKQAVMLGKWFTLQKGQLSLPWLVEKISQIPFVGSLLGSPEELDTNIREYLETFGQTASRFLVDLAAGIPDAIMQLALACIACYFFLHDGKRFAVWIYSKIPLEPDIRAKLTLSFQDTAISVVWASMAAAATQAAMMLVIFAALRVPGAFLAAGATFIFAWIPILGSGPVWIVGSIYLYLQGSLTAMVIMIVVGLMTGLADNFVRPWVLKGRGEMHPLVSLVAIFGGLQMFGLFGVLLGPIVAAVLLTMLKIWPIVGRRLGLQMSGVEISTANSSDSHPPD